MAKKQIATFLGPQLGISVAGGHAYAFSGLQSINTSDVTVFDFKTGDYIFNGELFLTSGVTVGDVEDGSYNIFTLSLNGIQLMYYKMQSSGEQMPATITMPIIIPPRTTLNLVVISNGTGANYKTSASLAGKVHNA